MVIGRNNLLSLLDEAQNSVASWANIVQSRVEAYNYLEELYVEEFGSTWFKSELHLAIGIIQKRKDVVFVHYGGRKRSKNWEINKSVQKVVTEIFNEADEEQEAGETKFIGSKQVTAEQFALYSKGLYWMAGSRLLL